MDTLLTTIAAWLAMNFALPAVHEHPRIEFISPAQMAAVRYGGPAAARGPRAAIAGQAPGAAEEDQERELEGLYDDATRTIYLPTGWTGATLAERSVLVHEMVHHLQNVGGLKYDCPQAREKLAYVAQDRWLARSGRNLMDEFELDPLTVLLRTKCMH